MSPALPQGKKGALFCLYLTLLTVVFASTTAPTASAQTFKSKPAFSFDLGDFLGRLFPGFKKDKALPSKIPITSPPSPKPPLREPGPPPPKDEKVVSPIPQDEVIETIVDMLGTGPLEILYFDEQGNLVAKGADFVIKALRSVSAHIRKNLEVLGQAIFHKEATFKNYVYFADSKNYYVSPLAEARFGSIESRGDALVGGKLDLKGALHNSEDKEVEISDALNLTGRRIYNRVSDISIEDDLEVTGKLTVKGTSTFGNLLPDASDRRDLGSSEKEWQQIYVDTLNVGGSQTIEGNLTVQGGTTLGDASSDTITFTGRAASHLVPSTANVYDLGSSSLEWRTGYFQTSVVVGNASTTITDGNLTTSSGSLTLNPSTYTRIGDASSSPGTASSADDLFVTGDLEVDAILDLDGSVDADVTAFNLNATQSNATAIVINTSNTAGGIDIDAGTGGIDLATTGNLNQTIGSGRTYTVTDGTTNFMAVDSSGGVTLQPTAGQDLSLTLSGAGDLAVGTNLFYADTSEGRVGVGTTAPSQRLDLAHDSAALTFSSATGAKQILTGGSTDLGLIAGGNVGIGTTAPSYALDITGGANLSSGNAYYIAGSSVLNATTLGSGITSSSLTSVGTIGTGVWQGTSIKTGYGGTGLTTYTAGDLLYYSTGTSLSALGIGSANTVLYSTGSAPAWGTIGASSITADSLDFTEFADAMTLDATTTIDMDTNAADLNFDSGTFFVDSSTNRVGVGTTAPGSTLEVSGSITNVLPAGGALAIDAASTNNTGIAGVIDLNVDTTAGQAGIDIDVETITDSGIDTVSGIKVAATQTSTDNDVLYGIQIADLGGIADAGNEYALTVGTGWDLGLSIGGPTIDHSSTGLAVSGVSEFDSNLFVDAQLNASTDGVATFSKAGTIDDTDFTTDTTGLLAIDTLNDRIYFRTGAAEWHYTAATAGFQIPDWETNDLLTGQPLNVGDYLLGYVDSPMSDGALHGRYVKFNKDSLDKKLAELKLTVQSLKELQLADPARNLRVSVIRDFDEIKVTKLATFTGTLMVKGTATFEGELRVLGLARVGDLEVGGAILSQFRAGEDLAAGDVVFISGENTVGKASASSEARMPAIGLVTHNAHRGQMAKIATGGTVRGLSNLKIGRRYFASPAAGRMTPNAPSGEKNVVQALGVARSESSLFLAGSLNYLVNKEEEASPREISTPPVSQPPSLSLGSSALPPSSPTTPLPPTEAREATSSAGQVVGEATSSASPR